MKQDSSLTKISKSPYLRFVLFGLILSMLPALTSGGILKTSWIGIIGGTIIYSIAALGLNLLLGYSGLISLGTAGFMGLGAYISAYVTGNMGLPWEVGILAAVIIPVILGVLIGLASLRMEGLYLGIVTLCVSEVLRKTFDELEPITGGFSGKSAEYPTLLGTLKLNQSTTFILLCVVFVLMMILTYHLANGQLGRALNAMRGSNVAAQAMGVSLLKYRLIAFALATGYASLAGALYAHFIKFVYPSTWTLPLSLVILAIIVIGGLRSIYGTFVGALIVYALPDLVLKRIPIIGDINGLSYVFSGILIILVVLFYPGGSVKVFDDIKRLLKKLFKRRVKENV
ncbi:MAG: branched-chain amino acid ABC transporter permease [Clostridia bacterium]|nr:branched-chain amino acid ABC transporter permease [Clostridia bacterium]